MLYRDKYIRHEIIEKNEILDALEQKLEMPNPLEVLFVYLYNNIII